jgi:hypothetical protein
MSVKRHFSKESEAQGMFSDIPWQPKVEKVILRMVEV